MHKPGGRWERWGGGGEGGRGGGEEKDISVGHVYTGAAASIKSGSCVPSYLCNLPALMVTTYEGYSVWIPYL